MKKIKRLFSLVIVFSLVLGTFISVVPASAEEVEGSNMVPADVIGTDYEAAVRRLVAFGMIEGYPDGTYRPEIEVNRGQFAKLLVYALGLEDATIGLQGQSTGFSDVKGNHWARGYINIASGQGLIKGYPDGTFRPEEKVTYAHTLTMLVRALGYGDELLPGNWPENYVTKGIDVGITKGLSLPAESKEGSKRGIVAQLINNTLDSKVIEVVGYVGEAGVEYSETGETLLKDGLKISKYKDTRVVGDKILDDDLGKDQVRVRFLENIHGATNKEVNNSYSKNESKIFTSKFDVRPFIGEEVTTYLTDKDEVLYVERENDDKSYFDFVEGVKGKDVSLVKFNRDYGFADDGHVYVFDGKSNGFKLYSGKDVKASDLLGRMGKFVVRNNRIVFAEVLDPAETNSEFLVVRENQEGLLTGVVGTGENFKMDLRKGGNYDYSLVYNTRGQAMGLEDIEEGNLVYVQKQYYAGDEIALVIVVRDNRVEGLLGTIEKDNLKIGSKTIDVMEAGGNYRAYYKVDEYAGIRPWNGLGWKADMEGADGNQAVAYTDGVGRLAYLNVEDKESNYKFGIVTRTYADGEKVKIFTSLDGKEGEDRIFQAEKSSDLKVDQKLVGSAVKFRLNPDGEIAEGEFQVMPYGSALKMAKDEDFSKDIIKANNGKSYAVDRAGVTIISALKVQNGPPIDLKEDFGDLQGEGYGTGNKVDISSFEIKPWEDMEEGKYDKGVEFYIFTKDRAANEVEGLIFIGEGPSDEVPVYVLEQWRKGSETLVEYVTYPENKIETRPVQEVYGGKDELGETAYIGKEKATGELELYYAIPSGEKEDFDFTIIRNARIGKVKGDFIEIVEEAGDNKQSIHIEGSLIYSGGSPKNSSILKEGNIVDIVMEGNRARLVQLIVNR